MTIPKEQAPGVPRKKGRELRSQPLLGMRFEPVHWLWRNYIPLGKITLLAGVPGQGKSQLTCLLAAWTTRGEMDAPAGDVLLVSAEDDPKDTIGPRLAAAGADFRRVSLLDAREHDGEGNALPTLLSLPGDVRGLADALRSLSAPRLLVLDPISALLSDRTDAHKNGDVRRALSPLKQIAEEFGLAILLVTHLNKSSAVEPLARVTDSGAFTALSRAVLLLAPDPEDEEGDRGPDKVLAVAKANLAEWGHHSLAMKMAGAEVQDDYGTRVQTARIEITGTSQLSALDLLTPVDERAAIYEARLFLRDVLGDRWVPAKEVMKSGIEAGIAPATLRRAREVECQRPRKARGEFKGPWLWALRGVDASDEALARAYARGGASSQNILNTFAAEDAQDVQGEQPPPRARARANGNGRGRSEDARRAIARMLGEREDDDLF